MKHLGQNMKHLGQKHETSRPTNGMPNKTAVVGIIA